MATIVLIGTVASSFLGFRKDLILELKQKQCKIYTFISEYKNLEELKKVEQLGVIPVIYDLNRGGLNPISDIIQTYKLSKKIKEISPDLVFSFFAKPVIFGTLAAKIAKIPKIIGMLEGLGYAFTDQPEGLSTKTKLIKKIQIQLYRLSLPQLNTLIFLNPDDPKDLLHTHNIHVPKVEILGGIGLNLNEYRYQAVEKKDAHIGLNFLFIGRLLKEKGIYDFVEAAKIVKAKYPNTNFTILGSIDHSNMGALKQDELNQLMKYGIVEHPGFVSNVQEWIAKSDVFVLPSYREGVPRSTQEAMAIGRPIITTDVPGCRETVQDGLNGFIVEKWNPTALARKMLFFIENPNQLQKMGLESFKIAHERFDADKVNKRLIKILGI